MSGCTECGPGWDGLKDDQLWDLVDKACDCWSDAAALELADRERRGVLTTRRNHHTEPAGTTTTTGTTR